MSILFEMYISLFPAILAGVLNMVWCKLNICKSLQKPIDGNVILWDKQRLFGDNKTYKGFIGMIFLGIVSTIIWGIICNSSDYLLTHNYMYYSHLNTIGYNALMGMLFGFFYALFELPNSFIKRRLKIIPGKRATGIKSILFIFIDQIDSVIGCVIVLSLVYQMNIIFFILYCLLGALTHIIVNMLLFFVKLRKNMF